jgi:hypothetical protein
MMKTSQKGYGWKLSAAIRWAVILAVGVMSGCGGGGGGGSGTTSTSIPSVTPSTTIAPSPYTGAQAVVLSRIYTNVNTMRVSMGDGALSDDTDLDEAAQNHAEYLAVNIENGALQTATHTEVSNLVDFYDDTPLDRARLAGLSTTDWVEEEATTFDTQPDNGFGTTTGDLCYRQFWDSVYHLVTLTENQEIMGIGVNSQSAYTACVLLGGVVTGAAQAGTPVANGLPSGGGQQIAVGTVVFAPLANSTGVDLAFNAAAEYPNPVPDLSTQLGANFCIGATSASVGCVGRPIMVRVNSAEGEQLLVNSFTLVDGSGSAVAGRIIVPASAVSGSNSSAGVTADVNGELASGVAFLIPLQPLTPLTTYTVNFTGSRSGSSVSATWSFTTGAS